MLYPIQQHKWCHSCSRALSQEGDEITWYSKVLSPHTEIQNSLAIFGSLCGREPSWTIVQLVILKPMAKPGLGTLLKALIKFNAQAWDLLLPHARFAYNKAPSKITNRTLGTILRALIKSNAKGSKMLGLHTTKHQASQPNCLPSRLFMGLTL